MPAFTQAFLLGISPTGEISYKVKKETQKATNLWVSYNAVDGTWTHTVSLPLEPESSASAIPPQLLII